MYTYTVFVAICINRVFTRRVYMKFKVLPSLKTVKKFNLWKSDIADLENYRPYITVRQVNKVGRRHWHFCKKQKREVHLLSDGELRKYHKLLWKPGTIRVMEQYALDLDETLDIAVAGNLIHARNWETSEAYVMTTDFVTQCLDPNNPTQVITEAYSFKYFDQIFELDSSGEEIARWLRGEELKGVKKRKNIRTWQKFAIEREYWRRRGVKYNEVTEKDATKEEYWNIKFCEPAWNIVTEKSALAEYLTVFSSVWSAYFNKPLSFLLSEVAKLLNLTESFSLSLFQHTVLHHMMPLKHSSCIQLNRPVELML